MAPLFFGVHAAALAGFGGFCRDAAFGAVGGFFDQFGQALADDFAVAGLAAGFIALQDQGAFFCPAAAGEAFEAGFDRIGERRGAGGRRRTA